MAEIKKSINTSNELTDNKYLQDRYQRVNSKTHALMEAQNSLIDSLNQAIKSLQENSDIMINTSVETEHTDIDSM